jgi:hypothetical protein
MPRTMATCATPVARSDARRETGPSKYGGHEAHTGRTSLAVIVRVAALEERPVDASAIVAVAAAADAASAVLLVVMVRIRDACAEAEP